MRDTQAITLDGLLSALQALDPQGQFRRVSYNLTSANTLDPVWWTNIPYGGWGNQAPTPSPLQSAVLHVLPATAGAVGGFVDIVHLDNSGARFVSPSEGGAQTMARALAAYVNAQPPSATPVIRYLMGRPNQSDPLKDPLVDALFPVSGDRRNGLVTHDRARIYVGSFTPELSLARQAQLAADAAGDADAWETLVRLAQDTGWPDLWEMLKRLYDAVRAFVTRVVQAVEAAYARLAVDAEQLLAWVLHYVARALLPSVSWNHAKIVAVDGGVAVMGGANYWNEYAGGSNSPYDLSMTMAGDVAVDAHRFADYLWGYLSSVPPTDLTSWSQGSPLKGAPAFARAAAPAFGSAPPHKGAVAALTVGKNGLWPGQHFGLPVGIFDAVRDFLINVAVVAAGKQGHAGEAAALLAYELRDDNGSFWAPLREYGISPAAWASRFTHTRAISGARRSLRFSQQKFVLDDLMAGNLAPPYKSLVAAVNQKLGTNWDGFLWPYDTLLALGQALAAIGPAADAPAVQIVCSYLSPAQGGYNDAVSGQAFRDRLISVMQGMQAMKLIPVGMDVAKLVNGQVAYNRATNPHEPQAANHAKLTLVDDTLCYVGSDNAYPSYNQEFGTWIQDPAAVAAFLDGFWKGRWQASQAG